jgi:hypothetical protein
MLGKLVQILSYPKDLIAKNGKKSLLVFAVYFVAKWSITFLYGKQILEWIKG